MSLSVKLEKRFSLVTMSDKAVFFNCQCLDMILFFCYKTKWIKRKNMLVDTVESHSFTYSMPPTNHPESQFRCQYQYWPSNSYLCLFYCYFIKPLT